MSRQTPRIHRLPQRNDFKLIPPPLDLTQPLVDEKSALPAIIVTPSSPSHSRDFAIAFIAEKPKPSFTDRVRSFFRCPSKKNRKNSNENDVGPIALASPTTPTLTPTGYQPLPRSEMSEEEEEHFRRLFAEEEEEKRSFLGISLSSRSSRVALIILLLIYFLTFHIFAYGLADPDNNDTFWKAVANMGQEHYHEMKDGFQGESYASMGTDGSVWMRGWDKFGELLANMGTTASS